jgi:hypothetical protein
MASVADICAKMDGMVGTMAVSADAGQHVAFFIQACKDIMRLPANRSLTTWNFQSLSDIDEDGATQTGDADLIAATKFYGLLVGHLDDQANWVAILDADSGTLAGENALANGTMAVLQVPAVTTAGVEEFYSAVYPRGIALGTGLTVHADGLDGTAPVADALRGWILFI